MTCKTCMGLRTQLGLTPPDLVRCTGCDGHGHALGRNSPDPVGGTGHEPTNEPTTLPDERDGKDRARAGMDRGRDAALPDEGVSPIGSTHAESMARRMQNPEYRVLREEALDGRIAEVLYGEVADWQQYHWEQPHFPINERLVPIVRALITEAGAAKDAEITAVTASRDKLRMTADAEVQRLEAERDAALARVEEAKGIPPYAMLDVWMALGGDPLAFDRMWAEDRRSPPETWAQLLAAIRGDRETLARDTNPPAGPEFERLLSAALDRTAGEPADPVTTALVHLDGAIRALDGAPHPEIAGDLYELQQRLKRARRAAGEQGT
jgi:hypothetical protein